MIDPWFTILAGIGVLAFNLVCAIKSEGVASLTNGWLATIAFLLVLILAALISIQLQLGELILEIN